MYYITPISDSKELALLELLMKSSPDAKVRHRSQAVLLSHKHYSLNQIADILLVDRDTISRWLHNWESDKFESLADQSGRGRHSILNPEEKKSSNTSG
ncbi:MAG: helix-turn-helix domain-containing protein [Flammeovirgaceae bacterium]